jgi:hypothetical protein
MTLHAVSSSSEISVENTTLHSEATAPHLVSDRNRWAADPSSKEVILLALFSCVVFFCTILPFRNYLSLVDDFGDSSAYMSVASAIRHWHFEGLTIKQFWGYPYLMAAVSILTGVSDRTALLLISILTSLISVALAYRLWGGWIAGLFAVLNFDWLQRTMLGGSEPLAIALLFGTFLAARHERWLLAALLASCSTVVRPLGFFSLLAIGLVLLYRHQFSKLLAAVLIGVLIGGLYILPLRLYFGDPLATVHSYQESANTAGSLIGLPFHAIIKGTLRDAGPWTNLVRSFGWISLVLIGIVCMVANKRFRKYANNYPVEALFAAPFLLFIFSYNYPYWARGSFERFAIPVLPLVYLALLRWFPKDRRILWTLGTVSPVLAAASAVGVQNVIHMLSRL